MNILNPKLGGFPFPSRAFQEPTLQVPATPAPTSALMQHSVRTLQHEAFHIGHVHGSKPRSFVAEIHSHTWMSQEVRING